MTERRPAHGTPSRIPLRGVAMILIAVAIMLAAWGIYNTVTPGPDTTTVGATSPAAATTPNAPVAPATPSPQETATVEATKSAPAEAAPVVIHVLNNSRQQGLAQSAAERLGATGYVGNLATTVLYENTVFYTDNKEAAEDVAAKIGGVAHPRADFLPHETAGPGALVVVLTQDF